jgi:hypothetical protein
MVTITFLLNALCQGGMSIVSWVIVFIPFIFMTVIVTILLYVFGLDAATGTLKYACSNPSSNTNTNTNTNSNLIYSSTTQTASTTNTNTCTNAATNTNTNSASNNSFGYTISSDPQFQ